MSAFADSSAVVKLYAREPGSEVVRRLAAVTVSALARVEVPAAFWRKHRMGELSAPNVVRLLRAFEADLFGDRDGPARFATVAVGARVLDRAAGLCGEGGLRAYDAVQLASAIAARTADPECGTFACFDEELRRAAAAEGFVLVP